jgi:hypothetical protein
MNPIVCAALDWLIGIIRNPGSSLHQIDEWRVEETFRLLREKGTPFDAAAAHDYVLAAGWSKSAAGKVQRAALSAQSSRIRRSLPTKVLPDDIFERWTKAAKDRGAI